ncbi:MAG: putative zinc-binding peptidase [Leptospiraceae bacterium]|nr:putative zinc-binding peptidase [Leptospiraceae bacterium]
MRVYNCDVCSQLIYFENTLCVNCGYQLGYLPIKDSMSSIEFLEGNHWRALTPQAEGAIFKKCKNYIIENVCNWMIPIDDHHEYCISCRLNETIPNLEIPENRVYWYKLEIAKRRLIYSLLRLGLPLQNKMENPESGLAFAFLSNEKLPDLKETKKVMTGHNQGKITLNIAEANDAVREKMRLDMNERYRTLLGHFRHEIGHYYWFLLIGNNPVLLNQCREFFGDENLDYDIALKHHYAEGPPADWQKTYISTYASSHPWEDFAESWAHYLHMSDAVETARTWGLSIKSKKIRNTIDKNQENFTQSFEEMKEEWLHISTALNSLNRSMGMKDIYPFVWSDEILKKLRFIQMVIYSCKQIS